MLRKEPTRNLKTVSSRPDQGCIEGSSGPRTGQREGREVVSVGLELAHGLRGHHGAVAAGLLGAVHRSVREVEE